MDANTKLSVCRFERQMTKLPDIRKAMLNHPKIRMAEGNNSLMMLGGKLKCTDKSCKHNKEMECRKDNNNITTKS